MLEEEHRHEEREHKRKERALDREKRQEDKRRKQWEEYEKCLEAQAEKSEDLDCQEPAFHHPHRGPKRRHYEIEQPPVPTFRPIVSDPERSDYDEDYEDDYDFIAPFNGNGNDAAADKTSAY